MCDSVFEPLEECCAAVLSALSYSTSTQNEESMTQGPSQIDPNKINPGVGVHKNHFSHLNYLISKRSLGMLCELALTSGFLGQTRACHSALSSICRNTVPLWDVQLQNQHQQIQSRNIKNQQSEDLNK